MSFIGTSGWQYPDFRQRFYPEDLPSAQLLSYYAERFKAVEINSTFYHFSRETTYLKWRETTSPDFQVALKANRYFTHFNRLADPEARLPEMFGRMKSLGPKLGPILFQLPASFHRDLRRLNSFLGKLDPALRYTFELRHASWHDPKVYAALEKRGVAFCIYDIRQHLAPLVTTADFVYIRLHGPLEQPYRGSYSSEVLGEWAARISAWNRRGLDVYLFFDNTMQGDAIDNARELRKILASADPVSDSRCSYRRTARPRSRPSAKLAPAA